VGGGSSQGDDPSSYSKYFFTYTKSDIEVDENIRTNVQDKQIATWTLLEIEQVRQLNVGTGHYQLGGTRQYNHPT
jgi:hypothetical protein